MDNGTPFKQMIGNCYVHVNDFEKAYDFYTNILGLKADWKSNDNNKPLAGFNMENGTGFIIVGMPGRVNPLPYAAFHFQCKDMVEAHRYLKERGVEVTDISDDGHGFEFWDPEGNKLHTMRRRSSFKRLTVFVEPRRCSLKFGVESVILGYYAFVMENEAVHPWIRERSRSFVIIAAHLILTTRVSSSAFDLSELRGYRMKLRCRHSTIRF
jgi:catechol 2,3-dioxygenase-like lactoylglutathione lyase family enzyme